MTLQPGPHFVTALNLFVAFALLVFMVDYFGRRPFPRKRRHRHS
jgi:hypothetical protein